MTADRRLALVLVALLSSALAAVEGLAWFARLELRGGLGLSVSAAWVFEAGRRALGGDARLPHEASR